MSVAAQYSGLLASSILIKVRFMSNSMKHPIYFKSLLLENISTFGEQQTLSLIDKNGSPAPWTIIVGDNGVGKTTLLQCLVRMRPKFNKPSDDDKGPPPPPIEPELASEVGNDVLKAMVRNSSNAMASLKAHFSVGELISSKNPEMQMKAISTHCKISLDAKGDIDDFPYGGETLEAMNLNEPLVLAYGAGRFPSIGKLVEGSLEPVQSLFEDVTEIPNVESRLYHLDYSVSKKQFGAKTKLNRLKKMLSDILPDIARPQDIEILGLPNPGGNPDQGGIIVKTPYGSVPFRQLSLGYRTVFAWTVEIAWNLIQRYPDSKNPYGEPAIVIVDEIDLHLHPNWQRDIRKHFTNCFPNIQFIATAHSPLIAQISLDANLAVLRRESDYAVVESDPVTIKDWRLDQVLTSELFGFESARNPEVAKQMQRMRDLSQKQDLSPLERKELGELDRWILTLSTAESHEDQMAMENIRRAAVLIAEITSRHDLDS